MVEVATILTNVYGSIMSQLSPFAQSFINLFLIVILVFIYAIFIWKLYTFIATKNIFGLNLNKYNKTSHPFLTKLFAGGLYFLEYIIILPFLIFFWFAIFTIFLILLTDSLPVQNILIISAVIVAVIRMSSYYKEALSKDLAKLIPFTLLAVFIANWGSLSFQKILGQIQEIPSFFSNILHYLLFIIIIEIIMRLFDFIFSLFGVEEETKKEEETEEETVEE